MILSEWQPTLVGSLITLRPLITEDFEALYMAASDPKIWEQHPEPNRHKRDKFATYFQSGIASKGALAIFDARTGQIIGSSRFAGHKPLESSVEIGYTFLTCANWGTGHNSELKQMMLDYAFQQVEVVLFVIGEKNFRSQKAIEKFGAVCINSRTENELGGNVRTSLVYELKSTEWSQRAR